MNTNNTAAGNDRAHAKLSPSGAYRWMKCAGQPALTADMPNLSSWYAAQGTVAHHVAEAALRAGKYARDFCGETILAEVNGKEEGFTVDNAMADAVQIYVDWVRDVTGDDEGYTTLLLEQEVTLEPLGIPVWGTSDCIVYVPSLRLLIVADYKHGQGHAVEVEDNEQLRTYGLGALLLAQERGWDVEKVQTTIIQPRAQHALGPIRSHTYDVDELLGFAADLIDAAQRCAEAADLLNASMHDAVYADTAADEFREMLVPGDHCKWCAAENSCPARVAKAQEVMPVTLMPHLPVASLLTFEQKADLLRRLDALAVEDWIKSLRSSVQAELEAGATHPDWKLVPKRASRVWSKPEAEVVAALEPLVATKLDLYEMKFVTPAQAEKIVGKKNFPKDLAVSVSSGFNLAPTSDPRAAVQVDPGSEFDVIDPV